MKRIVLILLILAYLTTFVSIGLAHDDDVPRPHSVPLTTETSMS